MLMKDFSQPVVVITGAAFICTYVVSKVLLLNPTLIRKKKKYRGKRFDSVVIGHRGSRQEGLPENTIQAFEYAAENGAETIEFDVWMTLDKEVVVFHDGDLQRMTGQEGHVQDMNYKDLPAILPYDVNGDLLKTAHGQYHIPKLEEVLAIIPPEKPLIIEFKMKSQELADKVYQQVKNTGHLENLVWFSMQPSINLCLGATAPDVPRVTCVPQMLRLIFLYYLGLLPFIDIEEEIFGVPMDKVDYARIREQKSLKSLPNWCCSVLAFFFSGKPPKLLIPNGLMKHLKKRGMPVWFLGVNTAEDASIAIKAGATGFISDRPKFLAEFMATCSDSIFAVNFSKKKI